MPANAGPLLRILGLVLEMIGLSSIALESRDGGGHWFGMTSDQVWTIVAVGFAFWLTGTVLNYQAAVRRRDAARRRDHDLED